VGTQQRRSLRSSQRSALLQKDQSNQTDLTKLSDADRWQLYSRWLDSTDAAVRAGATIGLIHQCNFLLDKTIRPIRQIQPIKFPTAQAAANRWH
jgi:hypothetical protein